MVPKMTEIAGAQGSESARQLLASQHNAESTKAMVEADTREVHTKKDVQAVTMRTDRERDADARDGGGKRGKGKNGGLDAARKPGAEMKPGDAEKPKGMGEEGHGSFIDIRL